VPSAVTVLVYERRALLGWRTALLLTVLLPSVQAGAAWIDALRTMGMANLAAAKAMGTVVSDDVALAAAAAYRERQQVDMKFALEAARVARNEVARVRHHNDAARREAVARRSVR